MIIFNTKDHYDNLVLNGFEKYPNKRDLIILSKQWHFQEGVPINDIKTMLVDFCQKWNKEFNSAKYENTLIEVVNELKEPQNDFKAYDKISFYKSEVDLINKIVGENEKRLLFVLMTICKMRKYNSIYLNSGTSLKLKEIIQLSNVKLCAKGQDLLLGSLYRQKAIDVHIKPLLKCDIFNIENKGDISFEFVPSEKMIDEYDNKIKPKDVVYIKCQSCGIEVVKKGRNHKNCENCSIIINNKNKSKKGALNDKITLKKCH